MTVPTASTRAATPVGRYIAAETLLGLLINIFMAGVVAALINRAAAFNGATLAYVASDMAKATIMPILALGIGLTLVTRKRLAAGAVTPLGAPALVWAPRNLAVRMLLVTVISLVVLGVPATVALHGLGSANALTPVGLMLFKLGYGALIGVVVTPLVLVLALQDGLQEGVGASART